MADKKKRKRTPQSVLDIFDSLKEGGAPRKNVSGVDFTRGKRAKFTPPKAKKGVIDFEDTMEVEAVPVNPEEEVIDFEGTTSVEATPVRKRKKRKKRKIDLELFEPPQNIAGTF